MLIAALRSRRAWSWRLARRASEPAALGGRASAASAAAGVVPWPAASLRRHGRSRRAEDRGLRILGGHRRQAAGFQLLLVGQLGEVLEEQDADEVDGGVVGEQHHAPAAVQALDRRAHRQAARHHAAVAGGHHPVALLDRIDAAQIFQLGIGSAVAGQDGAGVGAVDHHRRARGDVGQQQHAADAVRDADDPTDQAALVQHRIADQNALFRAGVGQARIGERPPRIADHPGRGHRDRRIGLQAQQGLVAVVGVLQRQGPVAPLAHLGDLGLQPAVLGGGEEVAADEVQTQARPAPRRGDGAADGLGHHVDRLAGHAIGMVLQGLAPVRQQERHRDHRRDDQRHGRGPG
jgi:hypothetical protein